MKKRVRMIKTIEKDIEQIDKQRRALQVKRDVLSAEIETVRLHNIKAGDMLGMAVWSFSIQHSFAQNKEGINLSARNKKLAKLGKILGDEYHTEENFEKGINIQFDDGEVTITFSSTRVAVAFIKKYNLELNFKQIEEEISDAQDRYNQFQEAVDKVVGNG